MGLPTVPLSAHPAFFESTVETLQSTIESRLGGRCIEAPTERSLAAFGNSYRLAASELWFCSYGEPVQIHFQESSYIPRCRGDEGRNQSR